MLDSGLSKCTLGASDQKFEGMLPLGNIRGGRITEIKRGRKREREKDRSTVICNVTGMTRREQLDVAGCSCRRDCVIIVTLQPWSLSRRGLFTDFFPPLSLHTERLATTSASRSFRNSCVAPFYSVTMTDVGHHLYSALAPRQLPHLFTICERRNNVLRPRMYAKMQSA